MFGQRACHCLHRVCAPICAGLYLAPLFNTLIWRVYLAPTVTRHDDGTAPPQRRAEHCLSAVCGRPARVRPRAEQPCHDPPASRARRGLARSGACAAVEEDGRLLKGAIPPAPGGLLRARGRLQGRREAPGGRRIHNRKAGGQHCPDRRQPQARAAAAARRHERRVRTEHQRLGPHGLGVGAGGPASAHSRARAVRGGGEEGGHRRVCRASVGCPQLGAQAEPVWPRPGHGKCPVGTAAGTRQRNEDGAAERVVVRAEVQGGAAGRTRLGEAVGEQEDGHGEGGRGPGGGAAARGGTCGVGGVAPRVCQDVDLDILNWIVVCPLLRRDSEIQLVEHLGVGWRRLRVSTCGGNRDDTCCQREPGPARALPSRAPASLAPCPPSAAAAAAAVSLS